MDEVTRLHNLLVDADIPIHGVSKDNGNFIVQFKPEATTQQQNEAAAIITSFDPTPRQPRTLAAITVDINALTPQQKLFLKDSVIIPHIQGSDDFYFMQAIYKLLTTTQQMQFAIDVAAGIIRDNPRIAVDAGIPVSGDEPVT